MKKMVKGAVVALALALSLSFGVSNTADAAKVTVKKVTSVNKLTGSKKITLTKGKKATLTTTVTVTPNKAANKKVTYKTSKKSVATVSKKGVITAKKKGSATITVTSKKNKKKTAKVKVTVVAGKVTKVTFDKTDIALDPAATATIKATVKTKGKKPNKALVWTSSDETVATVSAKGVVTAVAPGTATITAKSTDGTNKSAKATVKVNSTAIAAGTADVVAEFELDPTAAATDFEAIVKAANLKDTDEVAVTINARTTETKKSVKDVREFLKTNPKDTKVKLTIKNDQVKKYGPAAVAVKSVKSVTVNGVKFTEITDSSITIDGTKFNYKADTANKALVLDGDQTANASIKKLVDAKVITATLK
ncbi:MAG: Ig-like domain-containing protein [Lachnospiraceae bacterium]|nr:Ig-like domain-containing protein [Lachnospiraceae bacterium]